MLLILAGWVALHACADTSASFSIDTNYPGGNVIVDRIEGETVYLCPDLRDTEGWWFYWNFQVTGASGRTLTFQFNGRNPISVRGPAVSTDGGATWTWLGTEKVRGTAFTYAFAVERG